MFGVLLIAGTNIKKLIGTAKIASRVRVYNDYIIILHIVCKEKIKLHRCFYDFF